MFAILLSKTDVQTVKCNSLVKPSSIYRQIQFKICQSFIFVPRTLIDLCHYDEETPNEEVNTPELIMSKPKDR